jgi:hypothetical protein
MNVIPLPPAQLKRAWTSSELEQLVAIFGRHAPRGIAESWEISSTEAGDPQFYILGPGPACECILSVSRIGRLYVLENGEGSLWAENCSLKAIARQADAMLQQGTRTTLVGRILVAVGALRLTIGERVEPLVVEPEELIMRLGPQLAVIL